MASFTHRFDEHGNGFPGVGDDVIEDVDGDIKLLTVTAISPIHTAQWQANYIYLECEDSETDWDELSEKKQDRLYEELCHVSPLSDDE